MEINNSHTASAWYFVIVGIAYSCFEKGCSTKPYATIPKDIIGMGIMGPKFLNFFYAFGPQLNPFMFAGILPKWFCRKMLQIELSKSI